MAAPKARNEANTVLIVFLIFFVITTIGLGVSTYTGYSSEDNKEGQIAQEKAKATAIEYERDWYKFCALTFLTYTGELQAEALPEEFKEYALLSDKFVMKRNEKGELYGSGNLPDTKMAEQPKVLPKATVERLLNKLEILARYKEDNGALKLESNVTKTLQDEREKLKAVDGMVAAINQVRNKSDADSAQAKEQAAAYLKVYDQKVKEMQDRVSAELVKYQNQFANLIKTNNTLTLELNAERGKAQTDAKAHADLVNAKDKEITELKKARDITEAKLVAQEEEKQSNETARKVPTDIRIVQIDSRGLVGYINVGSADRVTPQLTFSVFGLTPDGRVENTNKATVEVVNVVDAHLSQVRVTGQRTMRLDRSVAMMSPSEIVSGRDKVLVPVSKNDVIYNAGWHPGIQRHVAVAGIVALDGESKTPMADFLRFLEKNNIVVDAYIDLSAKEMDIHGSVTVQTDYLIMGGGPEMLGGGGDPEVLKTRIEALRSEAGKYGVEKVNVKRFLDLIGYRLPTTSTGSLSANYRLPPIEGGAKKKEAAAPVNPGQ